ncbi:MAG: CotH kinase family protein, partial [Sedimentisphaerales bacterium]|nr:CotH kinase family protein [Sedimentisphaerales bacterium]
MKNLLARAQVLAIIALTAVMCVSQAQALVTPENMYDVNTIHTLYIVMNATDFGTMRFSAGNDHGEGPGLVFPDPVTGEYDWWPAYLGQSPTDPNFIDVAISRKSAPALPSEADPQKFSLKIDISKPGFTPPGQRFGGKKKLSLECGSASSLVSEGLAWNIYNAAGVISGRCNWVKVYMSTDLGANYTYMGLYDNVEQIDEEFLEDHMPGRHDYGFLYHHTETLGEVKETRVLETNPFEFRWYPFDHADYMTEISTPSDWLTQTPQRVDMGQLIKFAVVENFIANQDGTVNKGNNFYYYDWATNPTDPNLMDPAYKQPRAYFPWDLDTCMIGSATSTPLIDDRGGNLVGGLILEQQENGTSYGYPTYQANYYSTYGSLIGGPLKTANLQALIATIQTAISAEVDADPHKEFTAAEEFARLNNYVAARWTYINGQLNALIPSPLPWSDGFESGNFTAGGWTTQNTDATVITGAKYTGTYGAKLARGTWIQKLLDTRGFTTIHVQYRR